MNLGRCSICTCAFELNDVSALRCGHTYHFECITKWISNSKTCPNCRTSNLRNDITKLFFDEGEKSFSQTFQEPTNAELSAQLKEALDVKCVLDKTIKEQNERVDFLESKLLQQKTKNTGLELQLQRKVQHIGILETQLSDQKILTETNEKYKQRLNVCEFYNLLVRNGGDEGKIDQFINQTGHPDEAKFLNLMRKQRDDEISKNKSLNTELKREKLERCKKEKENGELRKEIDKLRAVFDERGKKRRVDGKAGTLKDTSTPSRPQSSTDFSFIKTGDNGEIVHAAKNFAFADDSSIEILPNSGNKNDPTHLAQFDPLSGKKNTYSARLEDVLSDVFSPVILAYAKKANL